MRQYKKHFISAYLFLLTGIILYAQSPKLDFEHYKIGEESYPLSVVEGNERFLLFTGQAPLYRFDLDTKQIDTCLILEGFRPNTSILGSARSHGVVFASTSSGLLKSTDSGKSFFIDEPLSDKTRLSSNSKKYIAGTRERGKTEVYDAETDEWRILDFELAEWPTYVDINNHGDVAITYYNNDLLYLYDANRDSVRIIPTRGWDVKVRLFDNRRMLIAQNVSAANSVMRVSSDFGDTWTQVDSSLYTIRSFDCNESGVCVAVGMSDSIRVSFDFGTTWTTYDTDFGITRLSDVAWVRDSVFAAVGTNNLLLIRVPTVPTHITTPNTQAHSLMTPGVCTNRYIFLECGEVPPTNSITSIFSIHGDFVARLETSESTRDSMDGRLRVDVSQLVAGLYLIQHDCNNQVIFQTILKLP